MASRRATRVTVAMFLVLAAQPFVYAATQSAFWSPEHNMAPVVTVLWLGLLVALWRRQRWAWLILVALYASVLVTTPFDFPGVISVVLTLASFALLVSPQMRAFVHPRAAPA